MFEPRCAFAFDLCRDYKPTPAGPELGRALCHIPLVHGRPTPPRIDELGPRVDGRMPLTAGAAA